MCLVMRLISLCSYTILSKSWLGALWVDKDSKLFHCYNEDSLTDCVDAQVDPSLHWTLTFYRFCCAPAVFSLGLM